MTMTYSSSDNIIIRDGTGQAQRLPAPLDPAYISIDERSVGDWLKFARAFAKELVFFDADNNPSGDWERFLGDATGAGNDTFIADIISYINDPGKLSNEQEKMRKFSKPHLALFISFLQMMGHIKSQLNGFTKKHLDFYYYDVLGLNKKKPFPDMANVVIELADDINNLLVEKGTSFFAGKDILGKDLVYQTNNQTIVSGARVQNIKTLCVDKKITGIKEASESNRGDPDKGIIKMMQLALGDPDPGDALPDNLTDLGKMQPDYVANKLFLPAEDFAFLLRISNPQIVVTDAEWGKTWIMLENACKEKVKRRRQQALKTARETSKEDSFGKMFRVALGDPGEGDELPFYKYADLPHPGTLGVLILVKSHLLGSEDAKRTAALSYIKNELKLQESEFKKIMDTFSNGTNSDWPIVYKFLEVAQRKKRKYSLQAPFKEEWLNIYAIDDARAGAFTIDNRQDKGSLRFNTFGKSTLANELKGAIPANIGFAVASPQLLLDEGKRKITLTISFRDGKNINALKQSLSPFSGYAPFSFYLSQAGKQWVGLKPDTPGYGDFIVSHSDQSYNAGIKDNKVTKEAGKSFSDGDKEKYIIWNDGSIYLINSIQQEIAFVSFLKRINFSLPSGKAITCNPGDVCINAMQFKLDFYESDTVADISALPKGCLNLDTEYPVLVMVLNQIPARSNTISLYQQFKDLQLEKIAVNVQVEDIKALALQNDSSAIDYKKPFEPFGYSPEIDSSLYFAHPEICSKRLDALSLTLEWMNPPEDFKNHYAQYWQVDLANETLAETLYRITGNSAFTANLTCIDNGVKLISRKMNLFDAADARKIHAETIPLEMTAALTEMPSGDEEVLNWKRYFVLELESPDFQHHLYPELLNKQASYYPVKDGDKYVPHPLRKLILKPPYTPKLKSLAVGYTASFQINVREGIAEKGDSIYHITPFGYHKIQVNTKQGKAYFLPYFASEGELYIGFSQLKPPQSLPLLFQMAEGSANPDLDKASVMWSYLSNNEWKELTGTDVVSDSTNGLLNTGIIEFNIPGDASNNNTLIKEGLHWIRAHIDKNAEGIPDTIAIFSNAINAVFADNENANDHLVNPLPAQSIKETVDKLAGIKNVFQPFTSFRGKPAETDLLFYRRASERLRHKNRAITLWDYERIILEQFPEIYKVKCVPGTALNNAGLGAVELIVIPDIRGKLPFDPFQPKVPQDTLDQIQKYIEQRIPAWAEARVKNPSYVQVKTRFAVKFKEGYNEGYFLKKLEEDLKRFLSPWAYEDGADIIINGKIYADVIVNFIAERPYIAYVAGMKLFRSNNEGGFDDVIRLGNRENAVEAGQPDVILVSAQEHIIDLIRQQGYTEHEFSGINYMKVQIDFTIA